MGEYVLRRQDEGNVDHAPLMECGHTAQGKDQHGNWACVICLGLTENAKIIAKTVPNLAGRKARCAYFKGCNSEVNSSLDLAFFEYRPESPYDRYYCGCHGWD